MARIDAWEAVSALKVPGVRPHAGVFLTHPDLPGALAAVLPMAEALATWAEAGPERPAGPEGQEGPYGPAGGEGHEAPLAPLPLRGRKGLRAAVARAVAAWDPERPSRRAAFEEAVARREEGVYSALAGVRDAPEAFRAPSLGAVGPEEVAPWEALEDVTAALEARLDGEARAEADVFDEAVQARREADAAWRQGQRAWRRWEGGDRDGTLYGDDAQGQTRWRKGWNARFFRVPEVLSPRPDPMRASPWGKAWSPFHGARPLRDDALAALEATTQTLAVALDDVHYGTTLPLQTLKRRRREGAAPRLTRHSPRPAWERLVPGAQGLAIALGAWRGGEGGFMAPSGGLQAPRAEGRSGPSGPPALDVTSWLVAPEALPRPSPPSPSSPPSGPKEGKKGKGEGRGASGPEGGEGAWGPTWEALWPRACALEASQAAKAAQDEGRRMALWLRWRTDTDHPEHPLSHGYLHRTRHAYAVAHRWWRDRIRTARRTLAQALRAYAPLKDPLSSLSPFGAEGGEGGEGRGDARASRAFVYGRRQARAAARARVVAARREWARWVRVKEALVTRERAAWGASKAVADALSRLLDPQVIHDPSLHDAAVAWVVDRWHAHGAYTVADGRAWTRDTLADALARAYAAPADPALAPVAFTPAPVPRGPYGAFWTPSAPDALPSPSLPSPDRGARRARDGSEAHGGDAHARFLGALALAPFRGTPGDRQARLAVFQTALLDEEARAWGAWAAAFGARYGPFCGSAPMVRAQPGLASVLAGVKEGREAWEAVKARTHGGSVWAVFHGLEGPLQEAAGRDLLARYAEAVGRRREVASSQTLPTFPRVLLPSAKAPRRSARRAGGGLGEGSEGPLRPWVHRHPVRGPRGPFAGMEDPFRPSGPKGPDPEGGEGREGPGALGRGPHGVYTRLWAFVAVQERRVRDARMSRARPRDPSLPRPSGPSAPKGERGKRGPTGERDPWDLGAEVEAWWADKAWVPMPEALKAAMADATQVGLAASLAPLAPLPLRGRRGRKDLRRQARPKNRRRGRVAPEALRGERSPKSLTGPKGERARRAKGGVPPAFAVPSPDRPRGSEAWGRLGESGAPLEGGSEATKALLALRRTAYRASHGFVGPARTPRTSGAPLALRTRKGLRPAKGKGRRTGPKGSRAKKTTP